MQAKLEELLKALGLPIGLAVIISAVAGFLGLPLEQAFQVFYVLAGVPFVISLVIDVLKVIGIVTDGTAGAWSAAFNFVSIIGLSVLFKYVPNFDVTTWDAQILELAKAVALIVTWIAQLFGTKGAHHFFSRGLGIHRFSLSAG